MTPWWIPVLTTVAGGVVGILGAVAGPWLKVWTDRQERSRQERLDAYAGFAGAVHDLTEAMVRVQDAAPDGRDSAREAFDRALYNLTRKGALVQLLGPEAVRKASVELLDHVAERVVPLTGRGASIPPYEASHQASEGLTVRYDALIVATRSDLGTRS
jgi:hypothetical protein